jgi:cytochrome c5
MQKMNWQLTLFAFGLAAVAGNGYVHTAGPPVSTVPMARAQSLRPTAPHVGPGVPTPAARPEKTATAVPDAAEQRKVLDSYCVSCHSGPRAQAGLVLKDGEIDLENVSGSPEVWEKVVRKMRAGVMPPAGRRRPDPATYRSVISFLETELDRAAALMPHPGRPVLHRLNRAEYTNTIRDLLGLEIDGKALLPGDDSGYGFDNIADVLNVSSGLLDRYLIAAQKIARLAVGDATMRSATKTYSIPSLVLRQDDRMSEDLPFGSRGGLAVRHYFPLDGDYVIKISLQRKEFNSGAEIRGLDVKNDIDVRIDGALVKRFTTDIREFTQRDLYEDNADEGLEVTISVKAGSRIVGVTFPQRNWFVEGVVPTRLPAASNANASGRKSDENYGKVEAGIDRIAITGPIHGSVNDDTASRRQIFSCRPTGVEDEEACADQILSSLARRAYRRPATVEDVTTLHGFYLAGRRDGDFNAGIRLALERLLADPDFLFRAERDQPNAASGAVHRVSDIELASRLSFFLWSSIPDDELLAVAERGRLQDPAVLEQQVRRMLSDARAEALVDNFFGQWLYLRNLPAVARDSKQFPDWDENLREAFGQETELFLLSQLREDRPATELLSADYTFVNERLARHYGMPNVSGSHFRRVTYNDDRRSGLLGHGSILTVTSYANRTSPVFRGKWILENLLGTPPPPPPPNVPPFPETEGNAPPTSVRARMEQHRANPVCASCHRMLDPLGFALENFDAIGTWRVSEGDMPIDPSGNLPDGTAFDSPATFRTALLANREAFMLTLTEKLLTYALGRGVEYYDMPAVRGIAREAASDSDRWSALITSIVNSAPFQMRGTEGS